MENDIRTHAVAVVLVVKFRVTASVIRDAEGPLYQKVVNENNK